jgi:hypothetical protein
MKGLIAILGALAAVPACAHDEWSDGTPILLGERFLLRPSGRASFNARPSPPIR